MSDVLTEKEMTSLFNQTSKALRDFDNEKLSELMEMPASEEEAPVVEETPAIVESENTDDKDTTSNEVEKLEPSDKTAGVVDKVKVEPTELEKLREQLEKVSKENHSLRSQAGRVPHVQRRIQELDKKLEELAKVNSTPSSQPSAKIQPKVHELLKGIKETDPDLADAIAAVIAEATNGVTEEMRTKERETLDLLRKQEFQTYQEEEASRLLQMYPNAPDVFNSPSWAEWKKEQSARVAGLAESDSADDVAFAFEKYAKDMLVKYPDLAKVEDKKIETTTIPDDQAEKAKQVEAERQRKKTTAVNIGNSSAAGKVSMPDDPNALFKKYSEEIRKERTG